MSNELVMMVAKYGVSRITGTIRKSPFQRDMNMAEARELGSMAGDVLGKSTRTTFMAASDY